MLPPKPELQGPDWATSWSLPHQAGCLSGWFCHVVMCPLEVELGPQRLPWRQLFVLRNSAVVPGSMLLKRTWTAEEGTVPISATGRRLESALSWPCSGALRGIVAQIRQPSSADSSEQGAHCRRGKNIFSGLRSFWKKVSQPVCLDPRCPHA